VVAGADFPSDFPSGDAPRDLFIREEKRPNDFPGDLFALN